MAISLSLYFSSSIGRLPTTSASPPHFENGATSADANKIFIVKFTLSFIIFYTNLHSNYIFFSENQYASDKNPLQYFRLLPQTKLLAIVSEGTEDNRSNFHSAPFLEKYYWQYLWQSQTHSD